MLISGKTLQEIKAEYEKAESVGLKCEQEIALVEALMATQWQPIETAPRDGRMALVFRPLAALSNDEVVAIKRLVPENNTCWNCTVPEGQQPFNPTDGACHVTHWMPLPPIAAAIEAGEK